MYSLLMMNIRNKANINLKSNASDKDISGYKKIIDRWAEEGLEMGKTTSHNEYINAKNGKCKVFITPSVSVSHEWLVDREGKKILG